MMLIKCFPKCKDETINGDNMKEKWFLNCDSTIEAFMNIYEYQTENIEIGKFNDWITFHEIL